MRRKPSWWLVISLCCYPAIGTVMALGHPVLDRNFFIALGLVVILHVSSHLNARAKPRH